MNDDEISGTSGGVDSYGPAITPRCIVVHLESAKRSLVILVNCNVLTMIMGRKSCSQTQSGRERSWPLKLGQANARAVASRELDSASLRQLESGQSARWDEACIGLETSTRSTDRTLRGGRRQRARKESPGTWEARLGLRTPEGGELQRGSHNPLRGQVAASDGLIVAAKFRSSRDGAKEPWPESSGVRGTWS